MVVLASGIDNLADEEHYAHRLKKRKESGLESIWSLLDQVKDPEIPVLSLWDLGIISAIKKNQHQITVFLTPTYSGCPAIEVMKADILSTLNNSGYASVNVKTQLAPAWSSNWISPKGRERMREYGIAPPNRQYCLSKECDPKLDEKESIISITCPHCKSLDTRQLSEFGSTACKALHQCNNCLETFDYFKSI